MFILTVLLILGWSNHAQAQYFRPNLDEIGDNWLNRDRRSAGRDDEEPLETDRDSFTPANTVVGHQRTLVETSYSFIDNRKVADSNSFPELLARYGLTDRIEFRLGWNYEAGGGGDVSGSDAPGEEAINGQSTRETRLLYGLKAALTEQDVWLPRSVCIFEVATPTSGPETASELNATYSFGWTLPRNWGLDSAIRYSAASELGDRFDRWSPSIVLKAPLNDRWVAHGEYFGMFTQNKSDNTAAQYFSPGVHYLINSNCEVGVRVGWGLNQDAANFFSNVGLGVRF